MAVTTGGFDTQMIDQWLGASSPAILGGDFRAGGLNFI